MIPQEIRALNALSKVSMRLASPGKRFRNDMLGRIEDPDYRLTRRQALYLWYLVDLYRRQIHDDELLAWGQHRKLLDELPPIYLEGDLRPPAGVSESVKEIAPRLCPHTVRHPPCTGGRHLRCAYELGHAGPHAVSCPKHHACLLQW